MIKLNVPCTTGLELDFIREAIQNEHLAGDGPFTRQCEAWLEAKLNAPRVLLTTSCTHALEMAALLLNLQPGDEVLLPSFTFVSVVNAFVLRGVRPVFIDIHPDTLNLDETLLEDHLTSKTRVIVPVHYAGVGCQMDVIGEIAQRHHVAIVEDNAHGLLGQYRNQYLGTFGDLSALSFHQTKNIQCGEGGALVINDLTYSERAQVIREKGTNRHCFLQGKVDKYTWVDVGSSYVLSEILAAFLLAQLKQSECIQAKRQDLWQRYLAELIDWAEGSGVKLPSVPKTCSPAYHLFFILMPSASACQRMIAHLQSQGVVGALHYTPLHLSQMARQLNVRARCPITESVSERIVRLPLHPALTVVEQERVIEAVHAYKG